MVFTVRSSDAESHEDIRQAYMYVCTGVPVLLGMQRCRLISSIAYWHAAEAADVAV